MTIRLAAIGDLHVRARGPLPVGDALAALGGTVDALVVAGDITDGGRLIEAERAAELLAAAGVPVVAVLGNHDLRTVRRRAFRRILERRGIALLDGEATTLRLADGRELGIAGIGGCGGGFWPADGPDAIHRRASKALSLRSRREAARLDAALNTLTGDIRVVVTHFAPTSSTLGREPLAKYWMLGNSELGRVIDRHAVDLALHGHAHLGNANGTTSGGTPVRNVALAVEGGVALCLLERPPWSAEGAPSRPLPAAEGAA